MSLIKCKDCGKEISDTSKNCIHCGCPVEKMITCEECGKETVDTNKVCPNCGKSFDSGISIALKKTDLKKIDFSNKKVLFGGVGVIVAVTIIFILIIVFGGGKKVDLQEVYDAIGCSSLYCEVASDGSYLEIDTNPYNIDDFSSSTAIKYVEQANIELGFSEALYTRMGKTRALDGTLTDENDKVKVSWTYHPDNGFNVVYTLK